MIRFYHKFNAVHGEERRLKVFNVFFLSLRVYLHLICCLNSFLQTRNMRGCKSSDRALVSANWNTGIPMSI